MRFHWKYGKGKIEFDLSDDSRVVEIKRNGLKTDELPGEIIEHALDHPLGTPCLEEIIARENPRSIVIVVNDITRPAPYTVMLPPLLNRIEQAGIHPDRVTLLIANGIHRMQTAEENQALYGVEVCRRYRVVNHSPDRDLMNLGNLPNGMEIQVNRLAVEADLLIVTGLIGLHYLAGYSGGRKTVVPGIAGRSTIEFSHAMMKHDAARLGNLSDNPVHLALTEAARRVGVDFIFNVIINDDKQVVAAVAGDMDEAWMRGVDYCRADSVCPLDQPADIVIAGCGGYPKDINLYQAQKALEPAIQAVRPGGVVILLAQCREGMGEETFIRWVEEAATPEDIIARFHRRFELGGHKAYAICRALEKCDIVLVSDIEETRVRKAFLIPCATVEEGLNYAFSKLGNGARVAVIPEAPSLAVEINNNGPQNHETTGKRP
jgi:nickel-dependent lactate racemase